MVSYEQRLKRVNIQLPNELKEKVEECAGQDGISVSEFFRRSAIEHIERLRRRDLERRMADAYRASADEARELAGEWEAVDLEGWEE